MNKTFLYLLSLLLGGIVLGSSLAFLTNINNQNLLTAALYNPPSCPFHIGLTPYSINNDKDFEEAVLLKAFFNYAVIDKNNTPICNESDNLNTCLARFQNFCYSQGKCDEKYDPSKGAATITPEIKNLLCEEWNKRYLLLYEDNNWKYLTELFNTKNISLPSSLLNNYNSYIAWKQSQQISSTTISNSTADNRDYNIKYDKSHNTYLYSIVLPWTEHEAALFRVEVDKECSDFAKEHYYQSIKKGEKIPSPKEQMTILLQSSKDDAPKIEFYTKFCDKIISSQIIFSHQNIKKGEVIPISFVWTEPLGAYGLDEVLSKYVGKTWEEIKNDPTVCHYLKDSNLSCYQGQRCIWIDDQMGGRSVVRSLIYRFGLKITTASGLQFTIEPGTDLKGWTKEIDLVNLHPLSIERYINLLYPFEGGALEQQKKFVQSFINQRRQDIETCMKTCMNLSPQSDEGGNIINVIKRGIREIKSRLAFIEASNFNACKTKCGFEELPNNNEDSRKILLMSYNCRKCSDNTTCDNCSSGHKGFRCYCSPETVQLGGCGPVYHLGCYLIEDSSCQ